jgi:hypothetical protein
MVMHTNKKARSHLAIFAYSPSVISVEKYAIEIILYDYIYGKGLYTSLISCVSNIKVVSFLELVNYIMV